MIGSRVVVAENFTKALKIVLVHEGGKVDNRKDPGGRTNQGVIQRTYDSYRRRKKLPIRDVYDMTATERDAIYRENYWNVIQGDRLPPGIDYAVLDGAVHSGPSQSVKWLQRALGSRYTGRVDGIVGDGTLSALDSHPNHDALIRAMSDRRLNFLQNLATWKTFGKGWGRRVESVRATGQAWAMGDAGPAVEYIPGGNAKANIEDAKKAPGTGLADATAGTGVGASTITQAINQLSPLATNDFIANTVAVLTILGVVLALGGFAWRWYAKQREARIADALDLPTAPTSAPTSVAVAA